MYGEVNRLANEKSMIGDVENEAVMEGVEHLGQYVFEMTKAKVEALKAGGGQLPTREVRMGGATEVVEDEDEDADREEEVLIKDGGLDDDDEGPVE